MSTFYLHLFTFYFLVLYNIVSVSVPGQKTELRDLETSDLLSNPSTYLS